MNIKRGIKVNTIEESGIVQKLLFKLGYIWSNGSVEFIEYSDCYIFYDPLNKKLTFAGSCEHPRLSVEEFITKLENMY